MKNLYLDYAAATPIDRRVLSAMSKAALLYANPSSFNDAGRKAKAAIEKARMTVAKFLNARPDEVIFTSSGSETNQLGLTGALSRKGKGFLLTTPIEHTSVLNQFERLPLVTKFIPVDKEGIVDLGRFERLLSKDCRLVSVMYANNEIGAIEPIEKIGRIIRAFNKKNKTQILFHIDACQAAEFLPMDVQNLGVDLLSFNGAKIYGPHGIGVLFVRRGVQIEPLAGWAGQEHGLKAGTENTQNIVGLAEAVSLIDRSKSDNLSKLRDGAIERLKKEIPGILVSGPSGKNRLPNNIHVCISGLSSEVLLLELDKHGIYAGSGSACTSHSVELSHVLKAIGVPAAYIDGALRFSIGRETKRADLDRLVSVLKKIVPALLKRYKV